MDRDPDIERRGTIRRRRDDPSFASARREGIERAFEEQLKRTIAREVRIEDHVPCPPPVENDFAIGLDRESPSCRPMRAIHPEHGGKFGRFVGEVGISHQGSDEHRASVVLLAIRSRKSSVVDINEIIAGAYEPLHVSRGVMISIAHPSRALVILNCGTLHRIHICLGARIDGLNREVRRKPLGGADEISLAGADFLRERREQANLPGVGSILLLHRSLLRAGQAPHERVNRAGVAPEPFAGSDPAALAQATQPAPWFPWWMARLSGAWHAAASRLSPEVPMRSLTLHPASLVAGVLVAALGLLSMGQTPPLNARTVNVNYLPDPRDMVQIAEATPYLVPAGKIFVLTGLGCCDSSPGANLYVNGQQQVTGSSSGQASMASVPTGLSVPGGSTITLNSGVPSQPGRAWGYLAPQ